MKEIGKITSRDNQSLKLARKVRDNKVDDLIFIEGVRLVEEALISDLLLHECFVSAEFAKSQRRMELLNALVKTDGIQLFEVPDSIFQTLADTNHSQGVILIAKRPQNGQSLIEERLKKGDGLPIVIFLYEINDPSNVGAVMRTAEAAGAEGVIISSNSSDAFSSKALRVAMGAAFRLAIWHSVDIENVLLWAREHDLRATAADTHAEKAYINIDWKTPRLLVLGSEAHGLSRSVLEKIDETINIPMENNVESLNLAVSCGVILFEAKRQNSLF